ncbi:MAG TPA: Hsp20/alpha crystallin family protein [Armatimonadetes bacterium]|nr:Hsp20/alpha crystallin family protein [Armatimonadota bacterium]
MRSLVRWDPFRELATFRERMNRLFDEVFGGEPAVEAPARVWSPAVDVREDENELVVTAELPGMKREDIKVELVHNRLVIQGERKFEHEDKRENYHRIERSYGRFYRSFDLPASVNPEAVTAEYRDGVLTVHLPKAEEAKPKQIEVKGT